MLNAKHGLLQRKNLSCNWTRENMPKGGKKRSVEGVAATEEASKRFKETVDTAVVDEFICPITTELVVEAVMAEDGRVYEKSAIEEYFSGQGENRRSPVTNEPIGPKLIPALQVRNMLEKFVKDGLIDGEKAAQWKKRIEDDERVAELRTQAANGDADAMDNLGSIYENGALGVKEDDIEAFKWYEKATEREHFSAMASVAVMHIEGRGTDKRVPEGMALLGAAAQGGSTFAAFSLGEYYAEGFYGFAKNSKRARFWLEKVKVDEEIDQEKLDKAKGILARLEEP